MEAVRLREEADARKLIADSQRKAETAAKKAAKKAAYEEKKAEREAAEARGDFSGGDAEDYASPVVTPRERAVALVDTGRVAPKKHKGAAMFEAGSAPESPLSPTSAAAASAGVELAVAEPGSPDQGGADEVDEDWG